MNTKAEKKSKSWVVYILRCSDESLYTGITNNIEKRFTAHNQGTAAKYTRSRKPVKLLATSTKMDRISAMRLELKIKSMPKEKKVSALKKKRLSNKKSEIITCKECPNGCNLILKWKDKSNVSIAGNKCASGIIYTAHLLRKNKKIHIQADAKTPLFSKEFLIAVVELWNIELKKLHRKISIQGSPERSVFRVVLEDKGDRFFILEQIPLQSLERKKNIAAILNFLVKEKLARVQPYLTNENDDFILKYKNDFWQISPFVKGEELNREKYIFEKWRGPALADFLIELNRKSQKLPLDDSCNVFSLKNYVYKLVREINLFNKDICDDVKSVVDFLEKDFLLKYEKLPVAFCHGDYHPLNIIWSDDDIKCVIDWEFCGFKSELYDVANLIGCIGMEDPQSLTGELVQSFIANMKKSGLISKKSWKYLLEFIVALRFAWLAEWLRRKDTDMIRLELDYMRLLINNKNILQKAWL